MNPGYKSKTLYLKSWVSMLEIVAGLVCIGISIYYLIEALYCNPNAAFCRPLAMLPVVVRRETR